MPKQMALLVAVSIALVLLSLDRQRQWLTWWTTATTTFAALSAMTLQPRSASASLTLYQPWIMSWLMSCLRRARCGSLQSVRTSASPPAASTPWRRSQLRQGPRHRHHRHASNTDAL